MRWFPPKFVKISFHTSSSYIYHADPWNIYENPLVFLAGVYVQCETHISRIEKNKLFKIKICALFAHKMTVHCVSWYNFYDPWNVRFTKVITVDLQPITPIFIEIAEIQSYQLKLHFPSSRPRTGETVCSNWCSVILICIETFLGAINIFVMITLNTCIHINKLSLWTPYFCLTYCNVTSQHVLYM